MRKTRIVIAGGWTAAALMYWVATTAAAQNPVIFSDPNLEQAVRAALAKADGPLTSPDLANLTCLSAAERQIASLSGLEAATNLAGLYLKGNAIRDLRPLRGLKRLVALELDANPVGDLSSLAALTNLRCLTLDGSSATGLSSLSRLTNLVTLSVHNGAFHSLNVLGTSRRLTSLTLWNCGITDLSPLAELTNLSCLDLRWNSVTKLAGPTNLVSLYLGGNSLSNLPALQGLKQLALLDLEDNRIADLSPLAGLTNLTYLALSRNPITNYQVLGGLTNLVNLELRGNVISNLDFLAGLGRLSYADLAYNRIADLSPLVGLTNLSSLVLAGNPVANYGNLLGMAALSNLWLFDNALSNADFVVGLPRLSHLNLEGNQLVNIPDLAGLTNLTGLGLSRNAISDFGPVAALTNLTLLRAEESRLADLAFLTNLEQLTFLSLNHNRITNLFPLVGLTNLQHLYLRRNPLSDIQPLTNSFPCLLHLDLALNSLDLATNSPASSLIHGLQCQTTGVFQCTCALATNADQGQQCQGVQVIYWPTNQAARFSALSRWFISANAISSFPISVWEDPLPADEELVLTASSSDNSLVWLPNNPLPGTNYIRGLSVAAGEPSANTVWLTLTVVDDVGLSHSALIETTVVADTSLSNLCPNLDPGLAAAIGWATDTPVEKVSLADLLMLTSLYIYNADPADACVWPWLTNLTSLSVGGHPVGDLTFTTNLTHLTSLSFHETSITNLSFLQSLTELRSLGLYNNRLTDLSPLAELTNLNYLDLQHNLLTNISCVTNLSQLAYLDLRLNLLDLSSNSPAWNVIQTLASQGVTIPPLPDELPPQREPPSLVINSNWILPADRTSSLFFRVTENGEAVQDQMVLAVSSSNPAVVPDANVSVGRETNAVTIDWFLMVTPATNQSGVTTLFLAATNDAGLSTNVSVQLALAAPLPLDYRFFGMTNLLWDTNDEAPWFGQTNLSLDGVPAAQSRLVGNKAQSCLNADVTGPGVLSFWWKVSSEEDYDWLEFQLGQETRRISGNSDWQQETVDVPHGPQTLSWRYRKDTATACGMDSGWLSHVCFMPAHWLELAGPPTNSQCNLMLHGVPGQLYSIQTSTDLLAWGLLTNVVSTSSVTSLQDANAAGNARFYWLTAVPTPSLLIVSDRTSTGFTLSWPGGGVLQGAFALTNSWRDIGGPSPFYVPTDYGSRQFFRLREMGPSPAGSAR